MSRGVAIVAVGMLAVAAGSLVVDIARPGTFRGSVARVVPDFGVFFPAARLAVEGKNPYDLVVIASAEREIDPENDALPAMSPPWAIATLVPLTPFEFEAARVAWFFANLGLLIAVGGMLWSLYDGDPDRAAFGPLLVVASYPAIQALGLGQFSPLVVAGLVGFVAAEKAGRPVLAGMTLSLMLAKPQTQVVVAIALGLWILDHRAWRVVIGAALGTLGLSLLIGLGNPAIFREYFEALVHSPPSGMWRPPLTGTVLRLAFGWDRFWLTFLPMIPAAIWVVWWYFRHRGTWNWAERMPVLVLVSYLAAPYGWAYDHLVFLFVIVGLAARWSRIPGSPVGGFLVLGWLGMVIYYRTMMQLQPPILGQFDEFHWVWVPFAILALQLTCHKKTLVF